MKEFHSTDFMAHADAVLREAEAERACWPEMAAKEAQAELRMLDAIARSDVDGAVKALVDVVDARAAMHAYYACLPGDRPKPAPPEAP